ncbi:AAA family ATPase [Microbacterium kunmingense]|uniref:AAA family ATPase n=1 Tax=Microbacterium kunmingense TaxID=2915939 RepID=UPI002002F459|nr:AAA family ATPase [Microbacterium kunmingense]
MSAPFDTAWKAYHGAGWPVLPLPAGQKTPPPTGTTGTGGLRLTTQQLEQHVGRGLNIGVRMPKHIIGIDVDQYGNKHGWDNLEAFRIVHDLPPLPATWRSTSRGVDNPSGIRWYRVPAGFVTSGEIVAGVETIQNHHRYAVAPPSVHPEGRAYQWVDDSDTVIEGMVPPFALLAVLPDEWVQTLDPRTAEQREETAARENSPRARALPHELAEAYRSWVDGLDDDEPCGLVAGITKKATRGLSSDDGRSRHDQALAATAALVKCASEGHHGVKRALADLREAFVLTVTEDGSREPQEAEAEWLRLFANDDYRTAIAGDLPDPCDEDLRELIGNPPTSSAPGSSSRDDDLRTSADDDLEADIAEQVRRLLVNAEARTRFDQINAGRKQADPPHVQRLDAFLAEPDEDTAYRIDGCFPTGGNLVLAAQYKAGKSTLVGNLLHSLADGTDFLGTWATNPAARIVLLDNELDPRTLRRWLRAHQIQHPERIDVVSLRGALSTFDILDATTRATWAERIGHADVLILDCLRPVLDALGLDENHDAGRFLVAFDELRAAAGIDESVIVHHMGHSGERSRGDSRILDWPDATWRIVRESEDPASPRYFSALGRDVNVTEGLLQYDHDTRTLTYVGGTRHQTRDEGATLRAVDAVAEFVRKSPGSSGEAIRAGVEGFARNILTRAREIATERGLIEKRAREGRGGGFAYYPPTPPNPAATPPGGVPNPANPVYKAGLGLEKFEHEPRPDENEAEA